MPSLKSSTPEFSTQLLQWYDHARRDLPWRPPLGARRGRSAGAVDPYLVFVSEAMLQQTQVATVIPYFRRFIERFPTFHTLAAADEQEVLRLWQGLGYYSRARNLRAAARKVVEDFDGRLPSSVAQLLTLSGVGRYTAGAISSIAFDERAPIVDGNVARVICRLDRIREDPRRRDMQKLLWRRAEELLPKVRCGDFNSAMMELGATVCTPRAPKCMFCPVRTHCGAFAAGEQEHIPHARKAKQTPLIERQTYCIRRGDQWLIEQRPARGRWAGMWQFITIDPSQPLKLPLRVGKTTALGTVTHGLTHRRYRFDVVVCSARGNDEMAGEISRKWVSLGELGRYPLPRPHLKIAAMLAESAVGDKS